MKTIVNYAQKVKEQHALNKTLAPVETDLTSASQAYAVGQKFIYDGVLYQAKTAIAQGAALVINTNYEAADDVSTEIQTLTNNLSDEVETRAKLGAHNLAKNIRGVITYAGITYTPNADGSVTATCEGTHASSYDLVLRGEKALYLPNGTYVLSGGINANNYVICGCTKNGDWHEYTRSTGEESTFTVNGDDNTNTGAYLTVAIYANGTDLNETFYPMIRLVSDSDKTYQPYAMTNRELTEKVDGVDYEMQYNGAYFHVIKYGDYYHCYSNSNFTSIPSIDDWTTIGSVPNSTNRDFCGILLMNSGVILKVRVKADGNVQIYKVSGTFGSNLYIQCSCVLA